MRFTLIATAVLALNLSSLNVQAEEGAALLLDPAPVDRGVLEQHALALNDEIETLQSELEAAVEAAQGDSIKANAQIDTILAAFQPRLDDFLNTYNRFNEYLLSNTTDAEERNLIVTERDVSVAALKTMPQALRDKALNPPEEAEVTTH